MAEPTPSTPEAPIPPGSRRSGSRRPVAWFRRLLLALLVLGAAALVTVFALRRSGQERPVRPAPDGAGPGGEITLIGQGFEFTQTEKGRKVFRIRGDSVRVRQGNLVLLDQVGLTFYDEDGEPYALEADEATYDQTTGEAQLEGEVTLTGGEGIELTTSRLLLQPGGKLVEGPAPVAFRIADRYAGRADRLRLQVEKSFLVLAGDVQVDSLPGAERPASLRAEHVLLERDRHQIRADQDAVLRRGADVIRAGRINVLFTEDEEDIQFVRARWEVSGMLVGGGEGSVDGGGDRRASTVAFSGSQLSVEFDPRTHQARRVELESGVEGGIATVESRSPAGVVDTLTADYVVGELAGGALSRVDALGSPRLVERAPAADGARGRAGAEAAVRELESERLTARFAPGGGLATATAERSVRYRAADTAIDADRLIYDAAAGEGEAFGRPVRVVSDRGTMTAPHAVWDEASGILSADGGVVSVLEEGESAGLDGSPLGAGEGSVRVESREALWRDDPRSFLFRGAVRAWQGDNLVLAEALRGDRTAEGADLLTASGGVKTVWIPAPGEDGGEPSAAGGDDGGEPEPVEVTAREMVYDDRQRTLLYRGEAVAVQGRRELACSELVVGLDEDGRAESMTCTGKVVLDDRAAGHRATGERAVYDLGARTVTIEGAPVRLRKADGAQVEGRRVVYDIEAGTATAVGEAAAPPAAGGEG